MPDDDAPKVPKVHLYRDNRRQHFLNGAEGRVADTLCRGNYHHYDTTRQPEEVTCSHCLREMDKASLQSATQTRISTMSVSQQALIAAARAASARAYAPYSGFHVGAALAFADGAVVTAANVENASYGLALCAETVAVSKVMAEGVRGGLVAVAVVGGPPGADGAAQPGAAPVTPCGRCRQVLNELAQLGDTDPVVWSVGGEGVIELRLSALLPHAFGPANLG